MHFNIKHFLLATVFQIVPATSNSHHFLFGTPFPMDVIREKPTEAYLWSSAHEDRVYKRMH